MIDDFKDFQDEDLFQVSSLINGHTELHWSQVAEYIADTLGAEYVSIRLVEGDYCYPVVFYDNGKFYRELAGKEYKVPLEGTIAGDCLKINDIIVSNDLANDPRYKNVEFAKKYNLLLAIPLIVGGEKIGVIQIHSTKKRFSKRLTQLAKMMANHFAISIRFSQINQKLQEKVELLKINFSILSEGKDFSTTVSDLAAGVSQALRTERVAIFSRVGVSEVELIGGYAIRSMHGLGERFSLKNDLPALGEAIVNKSVVLIDDPLGDKRTKKTRSLIKDLQVKSILIVPIIVFREVLGIITLDQTAKRGPYTEDDINFVKEISQVAALAIYWRQMGQLAAMGEMAGTITHEVRTPLVPIGGYAEMIFKRLPKDDPLREKAKLIVQEVRKLEAFLRTFLDTGSTYAFCMINEVVKEIVKSIQEHMEDMPKVKVELFLAERGPIIWGNQGSLAIAIRNVVQNAVDVLREMNQGGVIRVKISNQKEEVIVKVANTNFGQEIPPENRERIFRPFVSGKSGTGFGLHIVRRILNVHHATIQIDSNKEWTTFIMKFPKNYGDL